MSTRLLAGGLVAVLALVGFLAGRQGGAEPARSGVTAPAPLERRGDAPKVAGLGSAPKPPALARERRKAKAPASSGSGSGTVAPSSAGTAPAAPTTTSKPTTTTAPSTTQTAPSSPPASSPPPDLGSRDE